jgi:hypothetical protein
MKEDDVLMGLLEQTETQYKEVELEQRYNDYGDRGAVDVVITDSAKKAAWVIEIKSDAAIESVTGANEIIRQFKKHKDCFFDGADKDYNARRNRRNYQLIFAATDACWQHLEQNRSLYERLAAKERTHVTLSHPDIPVSGYPFQEAENHDGWRNQLAFCGKVDGIGLPESLESPERVSD